MMNVAWAIMCIVGLAWGMVNGRSADLSEAALQSVMDAVQLGIRLAGGFALWSGMLSIVEKSGAIRGMTRALMPILGRLFPDIQKESPAMAAISMNFAANMLGLGNAATPMGLRAMRILGEGDKHASNDATDAMCMFLVINASSLQLFPSSVIALRAAANASSPASIVLPTLAASLVSTMIGISACLFLSKLKRPRYV